jgi:hypothetical protein
MPSSRHLLLKRRSLALKKNLLPKRASLTGNYTKRQMDGIAGYFVLIHAELESYFEEKSLELVEASFARWNESRGLSRTIFNIMCYYSGDRKGPPGSFDTNQFKDRKLETLVGGAVAQHRSRIQSNNGIKEADVSELLFPLGFSYSDLSTTLLASLDSFGRRRGSFAHQTLSKAITANQIDPFVEANTVEDIIEELAIVDAQFQALRAEIG